jgi:D-glycero-D-manno-heptose 1,7-bisphosphate phosphatase
MGVDHASQHDPRFFAESSLITARHPAVFLDRDGVLNEVRLVDGVPHPPSCPSELELLPLVVEACHSLHDAGVRLVVVTNQPDIARGITTRAAVDEINDELRRLLPLADVVVCPHDDADGCTCRKPLPGMIVNAAEVHGLALSRSVMVGDRWRDIAAGRAAGVATVFVDRNYDERRPTGHDLTVRGLHEATSFILNRAREDH